MKKLFIFAMFTLMIPLRVSALDEEESILLVKTLLDSTQTEKEENSWYPEYARESIDFLFKNWAEEKIEVAVVHYGNNATPYLMAVMYYEDGTPQIRISGETFVEIAGLREASPEKLELFLQNTFLVALTHEVEHIRWPHEKRACEESLSEEKRVWYVVNELLVDQMIFECRDVLDDFVELNKIIRECGPNSQEFHEFVTERTPCMKNGDP